ncbi:MAG: hypothetical protein LUQ32_04020 [Methanomicrobiales archaeon]|nr:hypothetical protein [Methanomicrobiales archaeon]
MKNQALLSLILLASLVLIPVGAAGATGSAGDTGSLPGLLLTSVLANLSIAFAIVLLFIFGLYAYASLARFAPYHSWIYLYLVSLTGIVWAAFLMNNGGSIPDVVFILTAVAGINLIVHILRFDRIQIFTLSPGKSAGVPLEQSEATDPLLSWTPPRF